MDKHRQSQPVDFRPDRLEQRVGRVAAADIGERRDAERAVGARASELADRIIRMFPGNRRDPANTMASNRTTRSRIVIY